MTNSLKSTQSRPATTSTRASFAQILSGIKLNENQVDAAYQKARNLIADRDIFKFAKVSKSKTGTSTLTICGLWRIEKKAGGKIRCFEYDLMARSWGRVETFEGWPSVPLIPLQRARHLSWWPDIVELALRRILNASAAWSDLMGGSHASSGAPYHVSNDFLAHYLSEKLTANVSGPPYDVPSTSQLDPAKMRAEAKALRSAVFDHVGNREVSSAILAISNFTKVGLNYYLPYAVNQEHVLRVARENRNLLPLLSCIATNYWTRKDLFSRKVWVRGERTKALADSQTFTEPNPTLACFASFSQNHPGSRFRSLHSAAALRWLSAAPLTVVRAWVDGKNSSILENLARANIQHKVPSIVWRGLINKSYGLRCAEAGVGPLMQTLYRAFIARAKVLWKDDGFGALKQWLAGQRFDDILDWIHAEGAAQGFPNKHCTWDSLIRRSTEWHARQQIQTQNSSSDLTWTSVVQTTLIDGVLFNALTNSREVAMDAFNLHHCAAQYASSCAKGSYRLFSVVEPCSTVSTLGLHLNGGVWQVEQHRGKFNGNVSSLASTAGHKLAAVYQAAWNERPSINQCITTSN